MAILLLIATPLCVAEEAKPNTLTPKEIADGWLLLFDGTAAFGWKIDGEAKVTDGTLVLGGEKETVATSTTEFGKELELAFESLTQATRTALPQVYHKTGHGGASHKSAQSLPRPEEGWQENLAQLARDPATGNPRFQLTSAKSTVTVSSTGTTLPRNSTEIGFIVPVGCKLSLRNVKLRPRGLQPIFNGKDLAGWKEFKGEKYKSKFTVTPEGWIHIKNGPGDLQTEAQWDDFVLQIDCLSNGDRLNSGVFFRCRPNEYQNGYEAQIHNGFTAEPKKEYTIEEFDPTTHQPIGKKKANYTAIDYGTGAIYRRIPARFQAAKDHEWFTMTVIARGNQIATWVNGIQMVDWTDNRPLNDNARNGCKLGKGHISLQGHDPTTDLSFRNIRIAELPK